MKRFWFIFVLIMGISVASFGEVNRTPSKCFIGRFNIDEAYNFSEGQYSRATRVPLPDEGVLMSIGEKEAVIFGDRVITFIFYTVGTFTEDDDSFSNIITTTPNSNEKTGMIISDLGIIKNKHRYRVSLYQNGFKI